MTMMKRLSSAAVLLLLLPTIWWLSGWQWSPEVTENRLTYVLYFITETASKPHALFTCMAFALFYFLQFKDRITGFKVVLVLAGFIILTQGVKAVMKPTFKVDRPFVVQMLEGCERPDFYALTKPERKEVVLNYYKEKQNVPNYVAKHHSVETSFSFPSGHSIFAAAWVFLAVGFSTLFPQKGIVSLVPYVQIWAIFILWSRLYLGMHYPVDEIASILIAWALSLPLFYWLEKAKTRFFTLRS